jgi:beta-glucosidase
MEEFLWGASIAMYQSDGCEGTQWAEWEKANAQRLVEEDEQKFGWVPGHEKLSAQTKDPANYISGAGVEHRKHYQEDFALLKSLGLNAFRFSVEWGRIEPTEGNYSEEEIGFLKDYISAMKAAGLEPVMSLWHWTMPTWFTDKGGFEKSENVETFVKFCDYVLDKFSSDVKWVIVLNEPMVYTNFGYMTGEWPPSQKSLPTALKVVRNLQKAYRKVYDDAKIINPDFMLSIAQNTATFTHADNLPQTMAALELDKYLRDYLFLGGVAKKMDFLGVNWYNSDTYRNGKVDNPNEKVNDLGWDMRPRDITGALVRLYKKYHLPIMVTENGLADISDENRAWWLDETVKGMAAAQRAGVKLFGYLHWSAFDNFEWDKGFWPRFGLIAVDGEDHKRTVRPSAFHYAEIISTARTNWAKSHPDLAKQCNKPVENKTSENKPAEQD